MHVNTHTHTHTRAHTHTHQAFTGDTLFIGSCGRPDLVGSIGYTAEEMARLMFKTLRTNICTLPNDIQVNSLLVVIHISQTDIHTHSYKCLHKYIS